VPQTAPPARTLTPEITVQAGLLGPFEISGTTNLPEGTLLPIWLEGDYPACTPHCGFEMEQAVVRNGHFQTTVRGPDPLPGRYTVHVTTAIASSEPRNVEAALGPSGQNLRGPYVAALSGGGRYLSVNPDKEDPSNYLSGFLVHYTQRIEIGEGGGITVCPKRGTADDCEVPGQTSADGSQVPAETSQVQPTDPAH
jgi:hypothetical protein